MAKGTRLESVRGESLRGFKSHSFRQWRRGRRPDGGSNDEPGRAPHGAVAPGVIPFVGWLVCAAWFFRAPLLSGFDRLHGDLGDTRLLAVLREHWWKVLRGEVSWRDPSFFHPWKGVLGYSDTFLLESVAYVPFRLIGAEPLLASQLTVIALSAVGFSGWWVFFGRLGLGGRPWLRLGLAALATFPHQLAQQVLHQQLASVWWLPWVLVLGHVALADCATRSRRLWAAGAGGLLWGLVLTSTLYVGWFVVFLAGLLAAVVAVGELVAGRGRALATALRRRGAALAATAAGFAIGLIPFALVYLPVLDDKGARPYEFVRALSPRPFDLVNLGRDNLLWGAVLRLVAPGDDRRLADIEIAMAVGPLLFAVAGILWWRSRHQECVRASGAEAVPTAPSAQRLAGALLLVAVIAVLLPVEWGPFSAWRAVYAVVPGAGALRVTGRLWLVVHSLVVVSMAITLASSTHTGRSGWQASGRPLRQWLVALLVVGLAAEQLDTADRARLDRSADLELMAAASRPPEWCEVVAVSGGDTSFLFVTPSVDAMRIASTVGLPTVHGYSGLFPRRYPIQHDADDYERRFRRYVRALDLDEAVCVFDLDERRWLEEPFDAG